MAIAFACPQCKKSFKVKDELAGKKVACTQCKNIMVVPAKPLPLEDQHALEAAAIAALGVEERAATNGSATHPAATAEGAVSLECPFCFETVEFSADKAGKKAPCPSCRRILNVPAAKAEKPKDDWRSVTERPTLAKVDVDPAMEQSWGNPQGAGIVSRDALLEAEVIVDRKTLAGPKRGIFWASAGIVALVAIGLFWIVGGRKMADDRRYALVDAALKAADAKPNDPNSLPAGWASEVYCAAGTFYLHESKPNAKLAAQMFSKARNAANQAEPIDRSGLLLEVLAAQTELIGTEAQVKLEQALPFDDVRKELRQTMQRFRELPPEFGWLSIETLTRKLGTTGSKEPLVVSLAHEALADESRNEALAIVALTLMAQGAAAEPIAQQALEGDSQSPRVAALAILLKKPAKLPEPTDAEARLPARLAYAEGYARAGEIEKAKKAVGGSQEEQAAVMAVIADAAADAKSSETLTEATNFVIKQGEKFTLPAWAVDRVGRACLRAGRADLARQLADGCKLPNVKPWLELDALQANLANSNTIADVDSAARVGEKTVAQSVACVALARHNARLSSKDPKAAVEAWPLVPARPVGFAGTALGLQDRKK
ncbi:MAG: hypothetical protein ACJ8C4_16195 [Gemmataceae bacterium]